MKKLYQVLLIGAMSCSLFVSLASCGQASVQHRENGWYLITDGQKDSLASTPIVTVKDFEALELDSDAFGMQVIVGTISQRKQKAWADATERAIGQRIGFVFNDTVITDPMINARIESGRFLISNPHRYDLKGIYRRLVAGDSVLLAD